MPGQHLDLRHRGFLGNAAAMSCPSNLQKKESCAMLVATSHIGALWSFGLEFSRLYPFLTVWTLVAARSHLTLRSATI